MHIQMQKGKTVFDQSNLLHSAEIRTKKTTYLYHSPKPAMPVFNKKFLNNNKKKNKKKAKINDLETQTQK